MHEWNVLHIVGKILKRATTFLYTSPQSKFYTNSYKHPKWRESQFREFQDSRFGSLHHYASYWQGIVFYFHVVNHIQPHLNLLQALRPRWLKASLEACAITLATLIVALVMEVAIAIVASINVISEHAIQLPIQRGIEIKFVCPNIIIVPRLKLLHPLHHEH